MPNLRPHSHTIQIPENKKTYQKQCFDWVLIVLFGGAGRI